MIWSVAESVRLVAHDVVGVRRLLDEAFGGNFSEDDWQHALGGWHVLLRAEDHVVAHAAVVPRLLTIGDQPVRCGYVEAVAVDPAFQRSGFGTRTMEKITALVQSHFELGGLSTGESAFYARLGWEHWLGPSYVRTRDGYLRRTADEDDGIMVLRCAHTRAIDLTRPIICDEREGDDW